MEITRVNYPVTGKRKYKVIHKGKEYTCYLQSFSYNLVVTGNGNMEDYEDITDTQLGREIILACLKL